MIENKSNLKIKSKFERGDKLQNNVHVEQIIAHVYKANFLTESCMAVSC